MSKTENDWLEEIKKNFSVFDSVPEELKVDEAFVKKAVIANPVVLRNADKFKDNEAFLMSVIEESPRALTFASDRLKSNTVLKDKATEAFNNLKLPDRSPQTTSTPETPQPVKSTFRPVLFDVHTIRAEAANSRMNDSSLSERGFRFGGRRRRKTLKRKSRKQTKLKRTRVRSRS
jgi:hypothetical protein